MNENSSLEPEGILKQRSLAVREFLSSITMSSDSISNYYNSFIKTNLINKNDFIREIRSSLSDSDCRIRLAAAFVLVQIEAVCAGAMQVFEEELKHGLYQRRLTAAMILASCDRVPTTLAPTLICVMEKDHWSCRVPAAAALMSVPTDDDGTAIPRAAAISLLHRALVGDLSAMPLEGIAKLIPDPADRTVRSSLEEARIGLAEMLMNFAAAALGKHELHSNQAVQTIVDTIVTGCNSIKLRNVYFLLMTGNSAKSALPTLIGLLQSRSTEPDLRKAIASVIGNIGKGTDAAKSLVKPLIRATRLEDWPIACNIVESLVALDEAPKAVIQSMVKLLDHADKEARSMAAMSLGKFADRAGEAVPALIEHLKTESDSTVWRNVIETVVCIGEPAIPYLISSIEQQDFRVLPLASEALLRIVGDAPERLARIIRDHPLGIARIQVGAILGRMGRKATPALPTLVQLLRGNDVETRYAALIALEGFGPDASEAATDLITIFLGTNQELSEVAGKVLLRIGPEAINAIAAELAKADESGRCRLKKLLARFDGMGLSRTTGPDYGWVGNDLRIRFFVLVGGLLAKDVATSQRQLAQEIGRLQALGMAPIEFPNKDSTLRAWLSSLEKKLATRAGRPIRLLYSKSTKFVGLTDDGIKYYNDFYNYIKNK